MHGQAPLIFKHSSKMQFSGTFLHDGFHELHAATLILESDETQPQKLSLKCPIRKRKCLVFMERHIMKFVECCRKLEYFAAYVFK